MERFRTIWDFLKTSFWFVPSLMATAALCLIAATGWMEGRLPELAAPDAPWFLYVGKPENALSVLSTVLASMITMATLVFSITMVVLTLAASQFGPRLIRNFMANPQTQFVLGAFVMTSVYCLLALPIVEMRESAEKLPYVSVSVALALTLVSIGLLVLFLDTLARSIVSETVIERVGQELDEIIDEYPELKREAGEKTPGAEAIPPDFDDQAVFCGPRSAGYVQAIQFDDLLGIAEEAGILIGLYFRAGHYVVPGAREIGIYPKDKATGEIIAAVRSAIIVGVHRTPIQDPDFAIRHLDEIATRALSPAVNDPYTAVAVIDRMSASLSRLLGHALPRGFFHDKRGVLRVISTEPSYAGLIGAAFNQIRQHGSASPIIVLHLFEALERMSQHVRLPEQHDLLRQHAEAVMDAAGRSIVDLLDRRTIEESYGRLERALRRAEMVLAERHPEDAAARHHGPSASAPVPEASLVGHA